jgi:hypothetical protein
MSTLHARTLVHSWAAAQALPFYDTVNVEQNPADPIWFTIEWDIPFGDPLTYCGDKLLEGSFSLVFFGTSGETAIPLLTAAEPVVQSFMANVDPSGNLTLLDCGVAEDFWSGGDAPLFGIAFRVSYELSLKGLP